MKTANGFTLIEILIVMAIIGVLTAISIPSYTGMQEKGRIGAINRISSMHVPELQRWIHAIKLAGSIFGNRIDIDTSGDGTLLAPPDLNNNDLASTGLVSVFVASKTDVSPWSSTDLWNNGGVANTQAACDAVSAANTGRISICYTPDQNQSLRRLYVSASNKAGVILYQKVISAD